MSKINKHGIIIRGLKAASGETFDGCRGYVQVSYNLHTGELYTDYHGTRSEYAEYHDPGIISIANYDRHVTMQGIADCVLRRLQSHYAREWYESGNLDAKQWLDDHANELIDYSDMYSY